MRIVIPALIFAAVLLALLANALRRPVGRAVQTWRAFRQFQQLLATPLGQAYVAGLRDNAASLQHGLDFHTWQDQMTQGDPS